LSKFSSLARKLPSCFIPAFSATRGADQISGHIVRDGPRLYLRLGDRVAHLRYEEWGSGVVVEEMTSTLIGGTCLVRILFDDGQQRTFSNDLDSDICCYYFGIRRQSHPLFTSERRRTSRASTAKRLSHE
jgi:hypothetical protein